MEARGRRPYARVHLAQAKAKELLAEIRHHGDAVDLERVLKHLGLKLREENFPKKDNVSGAIVKGANGAVVVVNAAHHPFRRRFTIAHECGHHVLHGLEMHIDSAKFRDERSATGEDRDEVEANAFAAELLMPEEAVRARVPSPIQLVDQGLLVEHLANKVFKVSADAMTWRLMRLGLLI